MKPQLLLPLLLAALLPMTASAQSGEGEFPDLFNTSAAYDMLAVFPQADKLAEDPFFTGTLGADTLFLDRAHRIDSVVRPSQLCNLYSLSGGSKDDPEQVVEFFASFDPESLPQKVRGAWIDEICSVRDELSYCLQRLAQAGYAQYWQEQVRPCLNNAIEQYRIAPEQLGAIHQEITRLAGGQPLDATGSRIYILGNIDNAFALLDETFCCTPLLLDPETARQYRIDFMQVYIHENLHRLSLSGELLDMLQTLYDNDDFYRTHEDRARAYGEGGNEAFVVAAERYVSRRLGRIDDKQVLDEFLVYCDGTHVLAPIVYRYLPDLRDGEPFDGEDAFVERELREDLDHLCLHFGQCRAPLRRGDACSGAEQVQRHVIGSPSVSAPFDGVQFRGCQPCRGVIPHGVAHVVLRPGVEGVTPLCRELFRRTLEVGAIHC